MYTVFFIFFNNEVLSNYFILYLESFKDIF